MTDPLSSYQFNCCVVSTTNNTAVSIKLSRAQLNAILLMPRLARDAVSSVFVLQDGVVDDLNQNALMFVEIEALGYVRDVTPPMLLSWDIGLSEANITLLITSMNQWLCPCSVRMP